MRRVWRTVVFVHLLTWGASGAHAAVSPASELQASLVTSFGRQLDPDFPGESFGLEPSAAWQPEAGLLRVRGLLDRPLDPHKPLRVPYTELLGVYLVHRSRAIDLGLFAQVNGQNLHQLSTEGLQLRQAAGLALQTRFGERFQLEFFAGPFGCLNEYERKRNGDPFSQAGFLEQAGLTFQSGAIKLELLLLAVQDWNGRWRNYYSSFERITFRVARQWSFGFTHQLMRSQVDEVSGALAPIGFFDGRKSRIAGFILWQI